MTWSVSFTRPSKAEAKRAAVKLLADAMLGQEPHSRDYDLVLDAVRGAVDVCAEGAVTVVASGYLNGDWQGGDITQVRGVYMSLQVTSTGA